MATLLHKNPCPGGHENYNFGGPFIGYHYYILSLYGLFTEVEKSFFFKEIHQFYTFYPKLPPLGVGWGVIKLTISCLFTIQMLHKIWLRLVQ